jgi:CRISPR-associated protein Cas2
MVVRTRYLVGYDIRNSNRLRKTHEIVKAYGYRVQYSVFVCDLTKSEKIRMQEELREIINANADSVVLIDLGPSRARGTECFEFMGVREALPRDGEPTIV